jgi:hypothetical protein
MKEQVQANIFFPVLAVLQAERRNIAGWVYEGSVERTFFMEIRL